MIPVAMLGAWVTVEAAKSQLSKELAKIDPIAGAVVDGAGVVDTVKLAWALGVDLNRMIAGGKGRGAATWEWLDGRVQSAGLTTAWKREELHAAVLYMFGDSTAAWTAANAAALREQAKIDAQKSVFVGTVEDTTTLYVVIGAVALVALVVASVSRRGG